MEGLIVGARKLFFVTAVLPFMICSVGFGAGPESMDGEVVLRSGHYESESLVCAYNIVADGDGYLAEAADSERIDCGDAGRVLHFTRIGINAFRMEFLNAGLAYDWQVLSPEFFLETVLKKQPSGQWLQVREIMFRAVD